MASMNGIGPSSGIPSIMNDKTENDSKETPVAEVVKRVKLDASVQDSSKTPKGKEEKASTQESEIAQKTLLSIPTQNAHVQYLEEHGLLGLSTPDLGLLKHLPLDLFKLTVQEWTDLIVAGFPSSKPEEITECIKQMEILWKVPVGTPETQVVFDTIDLKKFARWVGEKKPHIANLSLKYEDLINLMPHLEYFDMSYFNKPWLSLLDTAENIKHLVLQGCSWLENANLELITKFTSLESLDISFCRLPSDKTLNHLVTNLPKLTSLSLRGSDYLTDANVNYLTTNLRKIKVLDLGSCSQLTNTSLEHLVINLPGLTSLDLGFCPQLTDASLEHFPKFKELKVLNLLSCDRISKAGLEDLETRLPGVDFHWRQVSLEPLVLG